MAPIDAISTGFSGGTLTAVATVAAAAHGLEGHGNMGFAIGLAGVNRMATEPEFFGCGIADGPFAGAFGQLHQGQFAGFFLNLFDIG